MKTLVTLSLIQTIVCLIVILTLFNMQNSQSQISTATPPIQLTANSDEIAPQQAPIKDDIIISTVLLRELIRQEVSTLLDAKLNKNTPLIAQTISPVSDKEMQTLRQNVQAKIDIAIADGYISDGDMTNLQIHISRLDGSSRKTMLRQLLQAINADELHGNL